MIFQSLPFHAGPDQYQQQAEALLAAYTSGDKDALRFIRNNHSRLRKVPDNEFQHITIRLADAQLAIAGHYYFETWPQLMEWVAAVTQEGSQAAQFETAEEAIFTGDITTLGSLLHKNPALIHARSMRSHHSTLLHYIGANGVENQRTPANAVEVLQLLLKAGAEVDAEADMYGGATTLGLVATSVWPAKAGVLIPLLETLLEAGAAIDHPKAGGNGQHAVVSCLHNGRPEGADFLARRGALLDLEGAAGVGRLDIVQRFFNEDGSLKPTATKRQMELGFIWACEYGHTAVVEFLLNRGLDPGIEVDGMFGLHGALIGGRLDTVQLLIERKAHLETRNAYGGTALEAALWAVANSDAVYRWPDTTVDYAVIIETLLRAGSVITPGILQWLAREDKIDPSTKERLDALFRRYGATS